METLKTLTQNPQKTWIITKDHGVCNDCNNATESQLSTIKELGYTEHFKMYDDQVLYYSGYTKPNADFDPLDDFGAPNAGCTDIKYRSKNTGKYESL